MSLQEAEDWAVRVSTAQYSSPFSHASVHRTPSIHNTRPHSNQSPSPHIRTNPPVPPQAHPSPSSHNPVSGATLHPQKQAARCPRRAYRRDHRTEESDAGRRGRRSRRRCGRDRGACRRRRSGIGRGLGCGFVGGRPRAWGRGGVLLVPWLCVESEWREERKSKKSEGIRGWWK